MTAKRILGIISLVLGIPGFAYNFLFEIKYANNLHDILIQTNKVAMDEINSIVVYFAAFTVASFFLTMVGIYLLANKK